MRHLSAMRREAWQCNTVETSHCTNTKVVETSTKHRVQNIATPSVQKPSSKVPPCERQCIIGSKEKFWISSNISYWFVGKFCSLCYGINCCIDDLTNSLTKQAKGNFCCYAFIKFLQRVFCSHRKIWINDWTHADICYLALRNPILSINTDVNNGTVSISCWRFLKYRTLR